MQRTRHTREYWETKLAEYWDSGLTLADYCKIMDLPNLAASRWEQRFRKERHETTNEPYELVEITPRKSQPNTLGISEHRKGSGVRLLISGMLIELDRGFDEETLTTAIGIARSCHA